MYDVRIPKTESVLMYFFVPRSTMLMFRIIDPSAMTLLSKEVYKRFKALTRSIHVTSV